MKKLPAALALATLCLTLTSCGQSEEAKASLSRSFQKEDLGSTDVSRDQADCMADSIVDGVGVDQLKDYEVLTDDATVNDNLGETELSEEDAETVAAALVDCIGAEEIVEAQMLGDQMSEEQRSCVLDTVDAEQLTTLIAAGFRGGEPDADTQAQMQEDVNACVNKK